MAATANYVRGSARSSPARNEVPVRAADAAAAASTFRFSTFAPQQYAEQVLRWSGGYFRWEQDGKRQWYSAIRTVEADVKPASPARGVARLDTAAARGVLLQPAAREGRPAEDSSRSGRPT
ncbi:MAG: hypothetical protein U0736_08695 [Gemmataceae bacterium]